jgi:hypothetical protein
MKLQLRNMNKNIIRSVLIGGLVLGAFSMNYFKQDAAYTPRAEEIKGMDGYSEYLKLLRANQITGKVTNEDVALVMDQIKALGNSKSKVSWPLNWSFKGPDNVGGRTRCLVIDKDNPNILYTGGVSGSVFKSVNQGASWQPLTNESDNFGVVSMAQTSDGAIYYGTGENGIYINSDGNESSFFNGMGMFKSTDGTTFTKVLSANTFGNIYVLTAHPTQNIIYCGSSNGLRMSADGGTTWTLLRQGACKDIKINKNGVAMAYVGATFWRAADATKAADYTLVTGLGTSTRGAVAWSESDPDYCYLVLVANSTFDGRQYAGALQGIYKSVTAGATFTQEVGSISQFFAPFSSIGVQAQGNYNMAIGVHPRDRDRVFIGGVSFAEWTLKDGPRIIGNNFSSPTNPFGIHADKHFITFDNTGTDPIMYICNDGGIARTTNAGLNQYRDISLGYTTSQFFGIAAGIDGRVIGGTQDNNTLILRGETFPRKNSFDILGGDGFQCEISEFRPDVMFATSQYGKLNRSVTGGSSMSEMWDNRIAGSFKTPDNPNQNINDYFDTPLTLWENPDVLERIRAEGIKDGDDTLINSRLFFVMNNGIWMCNDAIAKQHDPGKPKNNGAVRWFRVSNLTNLHFIQASKDGNTLYATTTNGRIHKVEGLRSANFDTTVLVGKADISPDLTQTEITGNLGSPGRTVTCLALDYANPDRAVVTLGNYGNNNYVYMTTNLTASIPSWVSVQGVLPKFPVYHALISMDNPKIIILGTEFGIWATNNATNTSATWAENGTGVKLNEPLPKVPVFEVIQLKEKAWSGVKIYAGTHGMGIWESVSLTSGINKGNKNTASISAYPNPANSFVNVSTSFKGAYTLNVYNLKGEIVAIQRGNNATDVKVETIGLASGNYFVEVVGSSAKVVSKIIVQH